MSAEPAPETPAYDFALCTALRPSLFGYACKLTRDKDAAHDVVQDALLNAWKSWARFAPREGVDLKRAVSAWLHQIVHNSYIKIWRRAKVRAHLNVCPSSGSPGPSSHPNAVGPREGHSVMLPSQYPRASYPGRNPGNADGGYGDELEAALADLSPLRRQIVELVGLHDGSYHEVARVLGVPIGTVMSSLNRARNALIARMGDYAAREYGISNGRETREEAAP